MRQQLEKIMNRTVVVKVCCGSDGKEAMHEERVEGGFKGNDRKTSEGEQITASNNKLHSSCEHQKPVFLGLLKGLFLKSWSQGKR